MQLKFMKDLFWYMVSADINLKKIGDRDSWELNVDAFSRTPFIISAGVGQSISFELQLAKMLPAGKIMLFDPSPTGMKTIRALTMPSNIEFKGVALNGSIDPIFLGLPDNPEEGSYRSLVANNQYSDDLFKVDTTCVQAICDDAQCYEIDLLKLDIEGAEYSVLNALVEGSILPTQICVEFHTHKDISIETTTLQYIICVCKLWFKGYRVIYRKGKDLTLILKTRL